MTPFPEEAEMQSIQIPFDIAGMNALTRSPLRFEVWGSEDRL
jgi:hypothetical protein